MGDQEDQIVKLVVVGAAGLGAYKFLYEPWAARRALQEITEAQIRAGMQQGMGIEEAAQRAIAGACVVAAAAYKVPPEASGAICQGVGVLAEKGVKLAARGAVIAGKVVGRGAAIVGRGIGTGVKAAVYTAPKAAVKFVGKGVKAAVYTAPKAGIKFTGKVVKTAVYTAPKAVGKAAVKTVAKGAKAAIKSVAHGFGLWGLPAPPFNPFADHARRRGGGKVSTARRRRGLAGLPGAAPARGSRAAGAAFYTRHL
jgi:hypothetical protein